MDTNNNGYQNGITKDDFNHAIDNSERKGGTAGKDSLPYPDPAITNPNELASFPKKSKILSEQKLKAENEDHLVNKRDALREGRNITKTDNSSPNPEGFL